MEKNKLIKIIAHCRAKEKEWQNKARKYERQMEDFATYNKGDKVIIQNYFGEKENGKIESVNYNYHQGFNYIISIYTKDFTRKKQNRYTVYGKENFGNTMEKINKYRIIAKIT